MSLSKQLAALSELKALPFEVYHFPEGRDLILTDIQTVVETICPVLGHSERLSLLVRYFPRNYDYIETHSFYAWLLTFAGEQLGSEGLAVKVWDAITQVINPQHLAVVVSTGERVMQHTITISTSKNHWGL